jgi:hypothetical protein
LDVAQYLAAGAVAVFFEGTGTSIRRAETFAFALGRPLHRAERRVHKGHLDIAQYLTADCKAAIEAWVTGFSYKGAAVAMADVIRIDTTL